MLCAEQFGTGSAAGCMDRQVGHHHSTIENVIHHVCHAMCRAGWYWVSCWMYGQTGLTSSLNQRECNPSCLSCCVQSWSVLGQLLDVWTDRLDIITQPERRKICGLAFASLLTLNNKSVAVELCFFCLSSVSRRKTVIANTTTTTILPQHIYCQVSSKNAHVPRQT